MTANDLLYRAFGEYKKALSENRTLSAQAKSIAKAAKPDSVVVTHNVCHIDGEWIAAIERGLVFVGRAIGEDRQFIRSNGEVVPIEKVRHVSRESVVHLSKHSDLITREAEENEDILPEKLYTVERQSDYAVYENRFLYALLTRIRDFVAIRYDAIANAYRTYRGEYESEKKVKVPGRRMDFAFRLADEQDDVFPTAADEESANYLARMEKIEGSVSFYLRTPLMAEVAKADKIKSKITKTNVLRMNKNFKECLALYEYLGGYGKDGYTVERVVTRLDPLPEDAAEELALPFLLSAFLAYKHGLGVGNALEEEFQKEEALREELRQQALVDAIHDLKRRIEESGESPERYMLLLEERNAALEQDRVELGKAKAEIETLNGTIDALHAEAEVLQGEIESLTGEKARLQEEKEQAEEAHRQKLEEIRIEREADKAAHAAALAAKDEERREGEKRIRAECAARVKESEQAVAEKGKETAAVKKELAAARDETASVLRESELLRARLTATRREYGLPEDADDFTTEEGFNALEHEFEVLGRTVRAEWTDVKKMLRKEFAGGIRETMRRKKNKSGPKPEVYREMSADAARRAGNAEAAQNSDNTENTEAAEIAESTEPAGAAENAEAAESLEGDGVSAVGEEPNDGEEGKERE